LPANGSPKGVGGHEGRKKAAGARKRVGGVPKRSRGWARR